MLAVVQVSWALCTEKSDRPSLTCRLDTRVTTCEILRWHRAEIFGCTGISLYVGRIRLFILMDLGLYCSPKFFLMSYVSQVGFRIRIQDLSCGSGSDKIT